MTISAAYPNILINGTPADATEVMADFYQIQNDVNANAAHNGANSDITSLTGLTTPLGIAYGGTGAASAAAALTALGAASAASVAALAVVPTGVILPFAGTAAPSGYLVADGSLVSRVTYATLWTYAQASANIAANDGAWTAGEFSPGNGTTTFRIPDLRGYFIRGWANGSVSIDPGRAMGSTQADAFQTHTHTVTDPGHKHSAASGQFIESGGAGSASTGGSGFVSSPQTATGVTGITVDAPATGRTAAETRPINLAFNYCIKT